MATVHNPTDTALLVPSLDNLRLEPGDTTVTDEQAAAFVGHPIVSVVSPKPEKPAKASATTKDA